MASGGPASGAAGAGRGGGIVLAALLALAWIPSPAAAEIQIAVSAPLSGRHEAEGKTLLQSVEWAVAEINARGGLSGEQIAVRAEDDGCDDRRAEAAAGKLAAIQPAVVIGHPCGGPAQAAARIYAASGILFIAAAPRHPELTRRRGGASIFRLAGRDDLQSASTAAYLAAAYAGKRLAIVHDRTRYARLLVDGLKRERAATEPAPIPEFGIVASSKDYAATVGALRALNAEVVYFAGFPSEAAALWGQFRPTDAAPDLIGSDALANADTELRTLAVGARFATRVMRPFTAMDAEAAKPLIERLAAAGRQPTDSAVAAFAAVEIWAGALVRAGTRDAAAVARQLQGEPLPSILGAVAFDAGGDARIPSFEVASFAEGRLATEAIVLPPARRDLAKPAADGAASGTPVTPISTMKQGGTEVQGRAARPGGAATAAQALVAVPPLPVRHPLRRVRPRD